MGVFFRKRVGLGKLLNLNLSTRGLGLSLGVRGFHAGISSTRGPYLTASLPGTGLYMRHFFPRHAAQHFAVKPARKILPAIPHPVPTLPHPHNFFYCLGWLFGWALILSPVVLVFLLIRRLLP